MSESAAVVIERPSGVTVEVLVAAVCFSVSVGAVALWDVLSTGSAGVVLLAGWPLFALAGGVVLDQRLASRLGRTLVALGLVPVLDIAWVLARFGELPTSEGFVGGVAELAGAQVLAVGVAIPWAFRAPDDRRASGLLVTLGTVGAFLVLLSGAGVLGQAAAYAGWIAVVGCCAGVAWQVVRDARSDDRTSRRRVTLLLVVLFVGGVVVATAEVLLTATFTHPVTGAVIALIPLTAARLYLIAYFRPLDEHVLDLGLLLAAIATAAIMALLVRLGAGLTRLPSPNTSAGFTAFVTAVMAVPAALWVRRSALARRYGNGVISPSDVALITADLHAQTEPRDLLDKAATMVASASGSRRASIVLGEDSPVVPDHWDLHPLLVGGDRVGALLVESRGAEGPELRQQTVIAQLLPTVALVARAVGLAVETEHARRDLTRERDSERARILGDLHDGLGPVLAGMSMRVQAGLRSAPPEPYSGLLADLADGLAASRVDLRRIVADIRPSALDDGDLRTALELLVTSFQAEKDGPQVTLRVDLDVQLPAAVQVAVYRSVAEGVTNALRHARATSISVDVRSDTRGVVVEVEDDGSGGPVAPGVGLSSLAQRAESLGGRLDVDARDGGGTRLHLVLPLGQGVQP